MRGRISQAASENDPFLWFAIFTTLLSLTIAIQSSVRIQGMYEGKRW